MTDEINAPGGPGLSPTWTSSAKSGVGTALGDSSRVSFTISHGILNEVYFPRIDTACTRDLGLIVTDGGSYFSEEKRHTASTVSQLMAGVPGYRVVNASHDGRYTIEKRIIADPERDVVLHHITLSAAKPGLRVFALLAPHLVNAGAHNTAWIETIKGATLPFASGRGTALCLAASRPFPALSVGFAGASDGFTMLKQHGHLVESYTRAEDGTVAICTELDLEAGGSIVLALGFGRTQHEAANRARASICDDYDAIERRYIAGWQGWQGQLLALDRGGDQRGINPYRVSTAVLRTHEARPFAGGMIASLSIPWGASKGDDDLGGYHLVWPRDLVESALGLLAAGAGEEVRRILNYLQVTQEADGHWPQNMWLDGESYWGGIQMDETAFPILLVWFALRDGAVARVDLDRFWPMIRQAAAYLLLNGPVTGQDRWEEDRGFSPFTLAVEIAGLVVAADLAAILGHAAEAADLLAVADAWNGSIERWCYAPGTDLAKQVGVAGHYVRISPETSGSSSPLNGQIAIKNRDGGDRWVPAASVVSPDALALVRFGLRAPDDPRIRDTVAVVDAMLKVELPQGPLWRRYNEDGYGEKADGSPFDGTGIGRAWPLMAAERAHYELARGSVDEARRLLETLERSSSDGGLIPEQIWDDADVPDRELFRGKPSGSAMPLVWAHAEHVKLLRSLHDGRVFDTPSIVVERYGAAAPSTIVLWRFGVEPAEVSLGSRLRFELLAAARLHWTTDEWSSIANNETIENTFGLHTFELDTSALPAGTSIAFTFHWTASDRWEGSNFEARIV